MATTGGSDSLVIAPTENHSATVIFVHVSIVQLLFSEYRK